MKKILGLDIGTNSIGWALVELGEFGREGSIITTGSRIIPMDGDAMQKFESGNPVSKNADRRMARTARRLKQRFKLRRTRLIEALKILQWLPGDFPSDFKSYKEANQDKPFSISHYLPFDFSTIEEAWNAFDASNIPEDWVVYYLRKKALSEKISLNELVRIIYMMNQRRGFKSSRKDQKQQDITDDIKYPLFEKRVQLLFIDDIREISEERGLKLLEIKTGEITGQIKRRNIPNWKGTTVELEVTKKTLKSGEISYSFSTPDPDDWVNKKAALEESIKTSGYYVGEYFFHQLVNDKNYRIRQRIVDRSLYIEEFRAIWQKQSEFHSELNDVSQIPDIASVLYRHNLQKQQELIANNLLYLLQNDIIYYQRPLKSQKHSIAFCNLEVKYDEQGCSYGIRVAPKSSLEFQEFRIWQTIHNLRVLKQEGQVSGKTQIDVDCSNQLLNNEAKGRLYKLFDSRASVSTFAILRELKLSEKEYRLNYPSDKEFPGNETKSIFRKIFKEHGLKEAGEMLLADIKKRTKLWHIIYSLDDVKSIQSALRNPKHGFNLPESAIVHLSKIPDLPKQYAAFSSKAINKMLPLMRCGQYFDPENIAEPIKDRINKIITGEFDTGINDETRKKLAAFADMQSFQGLPTWLASYVIYGRHSEKEFEGKYTVPSEIDIMKLIPNNSLRNPVVEQIIKECLSLVKDIWQRYGQPTEIHIELSRNLKKTAEERKKMDDQNKANEAERRRIRAILRELPYGNPDSLADIDRIKLWEETGNEIARTSSVKFSKEPTRSEIEKYKLWGEQNHISPYTGKVIQLSKLFTPEYEIEHIIPRSRYFDNSFLNKTICETYVNDFKGHRTARNLIETDGGRTITHKGHTFTLLTPEAFYDHCKQTFRGAKYRNLMREDIPTDFVQRQINDTRYITRKLAELLYPIAKDKEGIVFTIGQITSELKDKWGLNRVWKEILRPRFERIQEITGERLIDLDEKTNNIHFKKDYKRVDHRHHSLDALVVACTTREHIRYLNSLNAAEESSKYRYLVKTRYSDFALPWETFTKDARGQLQEIIVSHKSRNRLVSKAINKYTKWIQKPDGRWVKELIRQEKGQLLSVRKSMFKEPFGKILLREYRNVSVKEAITRQREFLLSKTRDITPQVADRHLRHIINEIIKNSGFDLNEAGKFLKKHPIKDNDGNIVTKIQLLEFKEYAAKRVSLDTSFTIDKINNKMPNAQFSRIAKLLVEHLREFNNDPTQAFRGEAMDLLTKKAGKPINKVTTFEKTGKKETFAGSLVESDKGTNVFFAMYEHLQTKERIINKDSSVPMLDAIERLSTKCPLVDDKQGYRTIILSPNDLVYVPEEGENVSIIDWTKEKERLQRRIYKMVSCSKNTCYFIPHYVSGLLLPYDNKTKKGEFGSLNKSEKSIDEIMIKNVCIKIKVDRLGNVIEANGKKILQPAIAEQPSYESMI